MVAEIEKARSSPRNFNRIGAPDLSIFLRFICVGREVDP
jgi:hypothetical protein